MTLPFTHLFKTHLERVALTYRAFGEQVGSSHTYVQKVKNGKLYPPLKRIEQWADALGLHGSDRAAFILSAQIAHCPEPIVTLIADMERRVAELESRQRRRPVAKVGDGYPPPAVGRPRSRPNL